MPAAIVVSLVGSALAQAAFSRWLPAPWMMPDFLLLVLAAAALRMPQRAEMAAAIGGVLAAALSASGAVAIGAAYAAAGFLIAAVRRLADLGQPPLQRVVIGAAEGGLLLAAVAATGAAVTLPLAGWIIVRIAVTLWCWPWVDARAAGWGRTRA